MSSRAPSPTEPLSFDPAQAEPRRRFLLAATSTLGGLCAVASALPFIDSMMPSERALAAGAPVEADLAGLRDGDLRVVGWRGKPVWLLKRSASMLEQLGNHDALLVDPQSQIDQQPSYCRNTTRSIRPEILIAIGICTHLGCSPTLRLDAASSELGSGWPGGFFCPCHGSKFDLAGRVFKNVPAPTNLEIPPHRYLGDSRILLGDDQRTT